MNSLLQTTLIPQLSIFKADEIKPAIDKVIAQAEENLQLSLTQNIATWDILLRLEEDDESVTQVFSSISHMNAVNNTPQLRENYEYAITKLTEFYTKVGQNKPLYLLYKQVQKLDLNAEQAQAVRKAIISFEISGVSLEESKRLRLQEISQELSQLSSSFENNVLDASMEWIYTTNNDTKLAGLPNANIQAAIAKSKQKGLDVKYALGIDVPTYMAVMQLAEDRKLRETFYKAYCTKASKEADNTKFDNDDNISKTLQLRLEESKLLDFDNYAEYSLFTKMAETPEQVLDLLNKLLDKSMHQAQAELQELKDFAKTVGFEGELQNWDTTFYAEKLKKYKYDFTAEELREYFPLEKVEQGLFAILKKIYGLEIRENTNHDKYIAEQKIFDFYRNDVFIGSIICDYFARDNKRGGAWMDSSRTAFTNSNGEKQKPVAYVTCNFLSPADQGANLTHNDVTTLFHEFGHALHHILSVVSIPSISGVNGVEWDAVELPSQFMENFCWCEEGITLISGSRDGKELSNIQIDKLVGARHFHSGLMMVRQLELSIFDMNIHHKKLTTSAEVQIELDDIRSKISLSNTPSYNKFQNGFSHIFAGGYAAGYYSYKWAEILSSDAFSLFEENGVFDRDTGISLLENIISKGSSRNAMDNFVAFMGRKPNENALLKHSGINA